MRRFSLAFALDGGLGGSLLGSMRSPRVKNAPVAPIVFVAFAGAASGHTRMAAKLQKSKIVMSLHFANKLYDEVNSRDRVV